MRRQIAPVFRDRYEVEIGCRFAAEEPRRRRGLRHWSGRPVIFITDGWAGLRQHTGHSGMALIHLDGFLKNRASKRVPESGRTEATAAIVRLQAMP